MSEEFGDRMVPLSKVMEILGGLCSDCQHRVRKNLAENAMNGNPWRDGARFLLEETSALTGVSIADMISPIRRPRYVEARRKFALSARKQGMSLPEIGLVLNRHHTTILHLINTGEEELKR